MEHLQSLTRLMQHFAVYFGNNTIAINYANEQNAEISNVIAGCTYSYHYVFKA